MGFALKKKPFEFRVSGFGGMKGADFEIFGY